MNMNQIKMLTGDTLPNMPWQEKPEGLRNAPVWRYKQNPIIGRNPLKNVARIFNSAVVPYQGEFIGVFRGEQTNGVSYIYLGYSKDGINWTYEEEKIHFIRKRNGFYA
jgi:beta-1,4-mannooligosaccharide/beta-1,4-mannosyl-N-acetylglucosamine phosphorylase